MRKNFLKVGVPTFRICSSSHILKIDLQRARLTHPYKIEYRYLSINSAFRRRILDTLVCRDE
ncbi:hypothetical protein LEP1GSC036_4565 [Leptospira weilii str. 2006001853]|uniref:Uncharacterized protein n=3 Tax=Leptospira weilii TaxID=28184 RepID=A0A828YYV3_9LEPT|nr:hypothetical protein LEP1GSC036_4565 [Leptospira weilii str. 2006001853]EMJ61372.1 hypothetical protein LEP1GSC051_2484 [Leptospira sp. P2653]EMM71389.1 hypothetical protein LEP1GSC038_4114 [Leptospira weilii str. 2006001855]EMN88715.1 hypothetical protein LEP1GSC108_1249 [Leptospira weilii str. UI 13098]OMI16660.1 hypothetical protein BUQ74_14195 [Leptospira weilii serovar Heyan]